MGSCPPTPWRCPSGTIASMLLCASSASCSSPISRNPLPRPPRADARWAVPVQRMGYRMCSPPLVGRLFPDDPPQFYNVPVSCHEIDPIKEALISAGFIDIGIAVIRLEKVIPDLPAFARRLSSAIAFPMRLGHAAATPKRLSRSCLKNSARSSVSTRAECRCRRSCLRQASRGGNVLGSSRPHGTVRSANEAFMAWAPVSSTIGWSNEHPRSNEWRGSASAPCRPDDVKTLSLM